MEGVQAKYMEAFKHITAEQAMSLMDNFLEDNRVYTEILKKGIYGM